MNTILSRATVLKGISCLMLLSGFVQAQNIPGGSGYPTGTVTPVLPANFVAGIKVNYVRTTLLTQPVTDEANILPTNYGQTRVKTSYFDGLGRAIQTVDHYASPSTNDVVNVVKYDNLGRDAWHFLPYTKAEGLATENGKFKLTAYSDQKNFYKNTLGYAEDDYFYTQTNYEPSPLNTILKTLPQGNSWVGNNRGTTITENPLPAGANIRLFTIAYAAGSLPVTSAVYATGDLMVKTITDEDGNFTEEYSDKTNRVVLKTVGKTGNAVKLQTYYVYDDFGLLKFVIPPKATVWLAANSWTLTATVSKELCFSYQYDGRLRMIVKNMPGAGAQYLIYNNKDELILTQTPTQAGKNEYLFNKYDVLGRLIQTGVYTTTMTPVNLQQLADAFNPGADNFLMYLFFATYGNAAYVNTFYNAKVLTTNYYDDYSFTTNTYDANYMNSLPSGWNITLSKETTNLLTGTKVVVLDGAVTPTELISVNFYNDRGMLLQTQAKNHKGGWNIITHSYDMLGQRLGTYTELNNPASTDVAKVTTIEVFNYDHAGRVTNVWHSLNGLPYKPLPHNAYDEAGRLLTKTFVENQNPGVRYEYNVRNWLTGINKDYCNYNTGEQTFGMEISYDYGYTTNYFNGNIAGIKWRNSGKFRELRSYGYTYDTYNRLKSGDFAMQYDNGSTISNWSSASVDFSASNMLYDENGNLQSMKQMGLNVAGQKIILDDLTYGYTTNSNKLASISESASSQSKSPTTYDKLGDFRDVAGALDYRYDQNGNVLADTNKSLTFTYDELINKTKKVSKGAQNVNYLYDANGNKLQKKVSGGATTVTTDYMNAVVYTDNKLSFVNHAEGRIRYIATATNKYLYDYYIKDHLGSTRSVICFTDGAITGFAKTTSSADSNEVKYIATSEPDLAAKENQLFDNVDITRSAKPTNKTATDNYVAKISSKNSKTILGPDITLKVMAGDVVKISGEALYIPEKTNTTAIAEDVIKNFITAFTTLPSLAAEGVNTIANTNTKDLANAILDLQNKNARADGPKAFLNYMLYDEHMNLVQDASGAMQVKNKEGWQTLETDQITIPENGFLRVFSNNMEAAPVSINNTTLAVIPGKLVEEYNYYPYGLVFGASSAASTIKKTDYLYNGKELQHNEFGDGNGMELEDYGARLYDPQIGRWHGVDPMTEKRNWLSPYNYCQNNPISRIDPNGALDIVRIDTKTREAKIEKTDEKKDRIFIDGKYAGTKEKGFAENNLKKQGFKIEHKNAPQGVGMGATDKGIAFIYGLQAYKSLYDAIRSLKNNSNELKPDNTTEKITERKSPGSDGAKSEHIIETDAEGNTLSKTHRVTKNGEVIHQHQDYVPQNLRPGEKGQMRQFPDEWVKYPKIGE